MMHCAYCKQCIVMRKEIFIFKVVIITNLEQKQKSA